MTNISTPLAPKPDRPIDPLTRKVVDEIQQVAHRLGAPVFVVGAAARIILLENVFGLHAGRATTDVDVAFALDRWEQFHAIKTLLLENPSFTAPDHLVHRVYFHAADLAHPYAIDLIPFGGIEASRDTIAWPPEMAVMMNVAGFSDAYAAAVRVQANPDLEMAVASLPGIAILKLFAWADRRHENPKDVIDLVILLRSYHEAGNESRIYEDADALAALEAAEYDPELAGAWLLGHDVATMASSPTIARLDPLLNAETRDRLIEDMARAMEGRADALAYASRLLEQFTTGLAA